MNWYLEALKKYAVFSGRARRKEYWMFVLFNFIISCALGFILGILHSPEIIARIIGNLYGLFIMVPYAAVFVRRMHDTDHSGWWALFPIVNLLLAVREGQRGDNRFGPDSKAATP